MRASDLEEKMSKHELFAVLLKGNSHEIIQLVDHVIFICSEQASPDIKLACLTEYYLDLKKQYQQDPDISASEIVIGPMMFQFLDLFAALNMMPGGATLN